MVLILHLGPICIIRSRTLPPFAGLYVVSFLQFSSCDYALSFLLSFILVYTVQYLFPVLLPILIKFCTRMVKKDDKDLTYMIGSFRKLCQTQGRHDWNPTI